MGVEATRMQRIDIGEALSRLRELLEAAERGVEIIITRGEQPIVRLGPVQPAEQDLGILGWARGSVLNMAPDFDETPEGFEDYT
jgi:antitoxin (DNA-binding transcriptional repressor) of toxin-antitoxin stability system